MAFVFHFLPQPTTTKTMDRAVSGEGEREAGENRDETTGNLDFVDQIIGLHHSA